MIEKKWYLVSNLEETEILCSDSYPVMYSAGGKWTSCSHACESREQLIREYEVAEDCSVCHVGHFQTRYNKEVKDQMLAKHQCFSCNLWTERAQELTNDTMIIGDRYLTIGPELPANAPGFRGFGGARFVFRLLDGTIRESTNVWSGGNIPKHLKHLFPDNAELISCS